MGDNGSKLKALVKAQFARRKFGGAVGIVDCTHVPIVLPTSAKRSGNTPAYLNG
jgi:hypothetical protein